MVKECSGVEGVELPDCGALDPTTSQQVFPEQYLEIKSAAFSAKVPCMNASGL